MEKKSRGQKHGWQSGQTHLTVNQALEGATQVRILARALMKRIEKIIDQEVLENIVAELVETEGDEISGALNRAKKIAKTRDQDSLDIRNAAISQLVLRVNSSDKMPRTETPKNIRLAILRRQLDEMLPQKPTDEIAIFALTLWSGINFTELFPDQSLKLSDLQKKLRKVTTHPFISRISTSNFHDSINDKVNLALEICPIYQSGTGLDRSRLVNHPTSKSDILNSRIGGKWQAMEHVIGWLAKSSNMPLNIKAVFADIGVLVSDEHQKDPSLIEAHDRVCQSTLENFSQQIGATLEWKRLSQIQPNDNKFIVEPFIISSDRRQRSSPEGIFHKDHGTFGAVSELCAFNSNVSGALINTYVNYPTTVGCNMALALERSETFFKLRSVSFSRSWRSVPTINILCR